MRPLARFLSRVSILSAFALGGLGCDRAPSAEGLKDWAPADHDGEKKAPNTGPKGDGGGAPPLVELTWRNQCQACHGPVGHGDGPQGAMVKAQDLSREEWQSKISDAEIAASITKGKGKMPKFDLSDEVVKGLVVRVRSFRGR